MPSTRLPAIATTTAVLRLKAIKLSNALASLDQPKDSSRRAATLRKDQRSPFTLIVFVTILSWGMTYLTFRLLAREYVKASESGIGAVPAADVSTFLASDLFAGYASLVLLIGFVSTVMLPLGFQNRDLARLDAEVEWFLTFPVSMGRIYASKIIERTLLSLGWFLIAPAEFFLLWTWGYRWSALPIAIALTLILNAVAAIALFGGEILLRRFSSASGLNKIQALATIFGTLLLTLQMLVVIAVLESSPEARGTIARVAAWSVYLFPGLAIELFRPNGSLGTLTMAHLAQITSLIFAGSLVFRRFAETGIEVVSGNGSRVRANRSRIGAWLAGWFAGVTKKELLLLSRDHRTLAGAIAPVLIMPLPFLLLGDVVSQMMSNAAAAAAISFSMGALILVGVGATVIVAEGDALWFLYTFPRPLSRSIVEKARFWTTAATAVSLLLWLGTARSRGAFLIEDLWRTLMIVAGMVILGAVTVSAGVLGADALAPERRRRVREEFVLLALITLMAINAAMQVPSASSKLAAFGVLALFAWAWWEKAEYHLDFLLDPTSLPPPRLEVVDALSVVVVYLFTQIAITLYFVHVTTVSPLVATSIGVLVAAAAALGMIASFTKRSGMKLSSVIRFAPRESQLRRAIIFGVAGALLAGGIGAMWSLLINPRGGSLPLPDASQLTAAMVLGPLAVLVVKPLVEEIVYRGLLIGALRNRFGEWTIMIISAGLFALLQPAPLLIPLFVVGLMAAFSYVKTEALGPSIAMHLAFYCGVALGAFV